MWFVVMCSSDMEGILIRCCGCAWCHIRCDKDLHVTIDQTFMLGGGHCVSHCTNLAVRKLSHMLVIDTNEILLHNLHKCFIRYPKRHGEHFLERF